MNGKAVFAIVSVAVVAVIVFGYISAPAAENKESEYGTIGIIGAMDIEVQNLKDAMDVKEIRTITGMDFYVGTMNGKDVVIVKCGMGKVNAGICAQMLIAEFDVGCIINTGVAGSLDNVLDIEDIVVSTDVVQHDFDVTPIGYQRGEIPYTGLYSFPADEGLMAIAKIAVEDRAPSISCYQGRICSGDQFIASDEQRDAIISNFGGYCCEMEAGAIGHVCYLNDVPFVVLRAISDKADGSDVEEYEIFERIAALRSADIVEYMVSELMS